MNNAVTSAGLSTQPDPPQDGLGKSVPPNSADILAIVHVLLAYARHLSLTLERRSTAWGFSVIAQYFGTARLPVIRARLARGILRIMALQRVLLSRAMRGRDTKYTKPYERTRPAAKTRFQQERKPNQLRRHPGPSGLAAASRTPSPTSTTCQH